MRNFIRLDMFILCSIWVASCGSHKSNLKEAMSIEDSVSLKRKDSTSVSAHFKKAESEYVAQESEETITVYDTSKPAHPVTGKHPILSETKKTSKKDLRKKMREDSGIFENKSRDIEELRHIHVGTTKDQSKQKDETTVPQQIGGMVWALCALVGLCIVGWVVYRWRRK